MRSRPDLPEESAPVGGAAARHRGHHHFQRGKAADRHPARLRPLELSHQSRQPGPSRVGMPSTRSPTSSSGEALGLSCVVIHPGSHMGAGRGPGLDASSPPSTRRSRGRQDSASRSRSRTPRAAATRSAGRSGSWPGDRRRGATRADRRLHRHVPPVRRRLRPSHGRRLPAPWRSARPPSGVGGCSRFT